MPEINQSPAAEARLRYIYDMLVELGTLSARDGRQVLTYLIEMTRMEANSALSRCPPQPPSEPV